MKEYLLESINKIREAYNNRKLVIFIGSGISVNSGLPSWENLIDSFASEIQEMSIDKSIDELTKIPQIYYNKHDQTKYFSFVEKCIDINCKPNDLHKILFEFEPNHIITTNYDDLLEKYVEEEKLLYDIIAKNEDLLGIQSNHLIIKMHGDVRNKNFVLKTDDYSDYNNNFSRISDYVKSLFSTQVILFIGFSAKDPNFRGMFREVSKTLKNGQHSYLIEVSKNFNENDFSFNKQQGITIIYSNDLENETKKIEYNGTLIEQAGINLYKVLKFIKDFDILYYDIIQRTFRDLKVFEDFNYIFPSVISKIISKDVFMRDDYKDHLLSQDNEINVYLRNIYEDKEFRNLELKNRKKELRFILGILKKARLKGIIEITEEPKWRVYEITNANVKTKIEAYLEDYLVFNVHNLRLKLVTFNPIKDIDYLKESFYLVNIENTLEAYKKLKISSFKFFRSRKKLLFLLCEFNRYQFRSLLFGASLDSDLKYQDIAELIKNELTDIDIEANYKILSKKEYENLKFLKYYFHFDFIFPSLIELNEGIKSLKKYKKDYENGQILSTYSPGKVLQDIENLWCFMFYNFLIIDYISEVKQIFSKYCEMMLIIYSLKVIYPQDKKVLTPIPYAKTFNFTHLNYYVIHLIVRYCDNDNLIKILHDNGIKEILVHNESKIRILNSMCNIKDNWKKGYFDGSIKYINNILILLASISLEKEEVSQVFNYVYSIMDRKFSHRIEKYLNMFIYNQIKINKKNLSTDVLKDFLEVFLQKIVSKDIEIDFYSEIILNNIVFGIKSIGSLHSLPFDVLLDKIIDDIIGNYGNEQETENQSDFKEYRYKDFCSKIDYLIMPLWALMNDIQRKKFQKFINENSLTFWNSFDSVWIGTFLSMINKELILLNVSNLEKLTETIKKFNLEKPNTQRRSDIIENSLESYADYLLLINNIDDELKNKTILDLKGISKCFDFRMNIEFYDMKNFDINWLYVLTDIEHYKLKKFHRHYIMDLIKKSKEYYDKKSFNKIILHYYLD